jgi:hypothetical protein
MALDKIEQKLGEWGEQGKTLLENNTIGKLRG